MPQIKLGAVTLSLIEIGRLRKPLFRPSASQEISLFAEVEKWIVTPLRVLESIVAGRGLDEWWNAHAHHARENVVPKPRELAEEQPLRFGELDRIGEPRLQQRRQRLGRGRKLAGWGVRSEFRVRPCRKLGKSGAAAFKRFQKVRCELFWIGNDVARKKRTRFVAVLRHVSVKNFP